MKRILLIVALISAVATGPSGAIADPAASGPTNGKIVFAQTIDGDSTDSYVVDPDGSDLAPVGPAGQVECRAASPAGTAILCNDWGGPRVQPAMADPDGSNYRLLSASLPIDLFCTFWSPGGNRVLCHSEGNPDPSAAGLYTIRSSDGADLRRVTASPSGKFDVANGYSPDGARILFSRFHRETAPGILFVANVDGPGRVRLTPKGLGVLDFFSMGIGAGWSPDGSRVAFAGQDRAGETALFVEDADGTDLHRITPPGHGALSAQWSPDGRFIAFTGCCSSTWEAWIVRPDGTGLRKLVPVEQGFSRSPIWSPDGRSVLFVRNIAGARALWTASVDRPRKLSKVTDLEAVLAYNWAPAPSG